MCHTQASAEDIDQCGTDRGAAHWLTAGLHGNLAYAPHYNQQKQIKAENISGQHPFAAPSGKLSTGPD